MLFNGGFYSSAHKVSGDMNSTWAGAANLDTALSNYMNSARNAALADRAWTAMREDTAIQRQVKDIKDAGLNPWLAIQNGIGQGAASSASQVGAETNAAMQIANSAASVLAQYASIGSKNFNNLANAINRIIKSILPTLS